MRDVYDLYSDYITQISKSISRWPGSNRHLSADHIFSLYITVTGWRAAQSGSQIVFVVSHSVFSVLCIRM